jgi:hypothetical protein
VFRDDLNWPAVRKCADGIYAKLVDILLCLHLSNLRNAHEPSPSSTLELASAPNYVNQPAAFLNMALMDVI